MLPFWYSPSNHSINLSLTSLTIYPSYPNLLLSSYLNFSPSSISSPFTFTFSPFFLCHPQHHTLFFIFRLILSHPFSKSFTTCCRSSFDSAIIIASSAYNSFLISHPLPFSSLSVTLPLLPSQLPYYYQRY